MKNKKNLVLIIMGIFSLIVAFIMTILPVSSSFGSKNISFKSSYKENEVTLKGTFYEKENAKYGVLICPGYSCDRAKWRPMANVFLANNISVMTFDYSGQGGSYGKIGFDNAKTDDIPTQIDDALVYLHNISNIDYENIILMGHSMGGRAILRLMYDYNIDSADTKLTKKNVKNIILFSPEVNYEHNAQASLFAATDDENDYPWKDYSPEAVKGVNVYLFGSTADDVVSDYDILRISERLSGEKVQESGTADLIIYSEYGNTIKVGVTSLVLHSYQMYSYRFASYLSSSITSITGIVSVYPSIFLSFVYLGWILSLVGIGIILYTLFNVKTNVENITEEIPMITSTKSFLLRKLLLWIPGLIMGFIICCICMVFPFGSPIMNIPYMCCIAGYGIIMLIFYLKKKVKGVDGVLPKITFKIKSDKKEIIKCLVISIVFIVYVWFILKMTMYNLIPLNIRIFWLIFATALMTIGYYISSVENDMLKIINASKWTYVLYNLIQYVALFLFVLFYLIIKSYSGFIGQMQNMILMYVFTIPLGNYIQRKLNNRIYGAIVSSFLFQAIMITSAAIISFF
jgi:pimeloyl-ACP methyl ester carboxylesterase